jgi:hypothetical protein
MTGAAGAAFRGRGLTPPAVLETDTVGHKNRQTMRQRLNDSIIKALPAP